MNRVQAENAFSKTFKHLVKLDHIIDQIFNFNPNKIILIIKKKFFNKSMKDLN